MQASLLSLRSLSTATVWRFSKFGQASDVLKKETETLASNVGAGQVLLQVDAAPINPADFNSIAGVYGNVPSLPAVGGLEGTATVIAVGTGVSGLKVNDRVISSKPGFGGVGTWRTAAVANADDVLPISANLSKAQLATLGVNPATAFRLLEDFASLRAGDTIVQNAANSAVGQLVVQLAAMKGVKTVNVIRARDDYVEISEHLKALGADVVVTEDFAKSASLKDIVKDMAAPRLALNAVGGDSATVLSKLLGKDGTLVTYGGMSRKGVTVSTSALIFNNISVKGFWITQWNATHSLQEKASMYANLAQLFEQKKLDTLMETFSFANFPEALRRAENPVQSRKVVLLMEQ